MDMFFANLYESQYRNHEEMKLSRAVQVRNKMKTHKK